MMGLVEVKADYWRNRDGEIVHTNDCIYSGSINSHPWTWADGMTRKQVSDVVAVVEWMRLCGKCWTGGDDDVV